MEFWWATLYWYGVVIYTYMLEEVLAAPVQPVHGTLL
jgi:hypothetical protein